MTQLLCRVQAVGALLLTGAMLGSGCSPSAKTSDAGKPGPQSQAGQITAAATSPGTGAKADFTVKAQDLTKEADADRKAATAKFDDKIIEVSGTVFRSEPAPFGGQWFTYLRGHDIPNDFFGCKQVDCQFAPDSPFHAKAELLSKGQEVKIRGKFYGIFDYGIRLDKCELVEAGPDPIIKIAAPELTAAYAADAAAADKKYKGKQLIVDGVVADLKTGDLELTIFLQGHDEKSATPLRIALETYDKDLAKKLAKGQKVKIRADCDGRFKDQVVLKKFYIMRQ